MLYRLLTPLLFACAFHQHVVAKDYIRYHKRSTVVQQYMAQGEHAKALALLGKLDKRYALMPTETVARAVCLASLGDTAAAHKAFIKSVEQRSDLAWIDNARPVLRSQKDSIWYQQVIRECVYRWRSMARYADGPNTGLPTPTTELNARHQAMYEQPGDDAHGENAYAALIAEHDALLKRFLSGGIPVPSIAVYGINQEFAMFVIHCSPELTTAHEKTFKRWLKAGLIYPELYATPFDDLANHRDQPFPYGTFGGLRPDELLAGHEKRRAAIGMGDERLERLRFNRPLP